MAKVTLKELHAQAINKYGEDDVKRRLRRFYNRLIKQPKKELTTAEEIIKDINIVCGGSYRLGEASKGMIDALIKSGYTNDDFKAVHRSKWAEWQSNHMKAYFKPTTLYRRSNFVKYKEELDNGANATKYQESNKQYKGW